MSIPASHRPAREWLLLLIALAVVAAIAAPFWDVFAGPEKRADWAEKWPTSRVKELFIGPEQLACYVCFVWACLILFSRYREVRRQRTAFQMGLLPTEEGARILPEDARPLARKVEQATGGRPYILGNMIRLGLGKYAVSKSAPDVAEVVRNQADVEVSRMVSGMAVVHYLVWAIPAIGFIGTVRGLSGAFGGDLGDIEVPKAQLKIAFDCTLVALLLSLVLMYLLNVVQRAEELIVADSQAYCQEHLLLRLYDPMALAVEE